MTISISTQQDLFYLRSGIDLAKLARNMPSNLEDAGDDARRACILGAVMCCASFLECSINGLYDYARTAYRRTKLHKALESVWSEGFDKQPVLAKYQIALALAGRESLRTDAELYQSAAKLVDLRNAIAHPKELIESEAQQKKLETKLKGRYAFNPPQEYRREFFPDRCLSIDCAFWSAEAAAAFFIEFSRSMPRSAYPLLWEGVMAAYLKEAQAARQRISE